MMFEDTFVLRISRYYNNNSSIPKSHSIEAIEYIFKITYLHRTYEKMFISRAGYFIAWSAFSIDPRKTKGSSEKSKIRTYYSYSTNANLKKSHTEEDEMRER